MTEELAQHEAPVASDALAGLLPSLARLDRVLERAAARVPDAYGAHVVDDRFRGLHLGDADLTALFARAPLAPPLGDAESATWQDDEPPPTGSRLAWLADEYALVPFDVDVLVLALACDLDVRYERLYSYLQDDVTRRRPTVSLALDLFGGGAAERLARRERFASDAPLVQHVLVTLGGDASTPLLARTIAIDSQITRFLLGERSLDERLARACRWIEPHALAERSGHDAERVNALGAAMATSVARGERLLARVTGPRGTGKSRFAAAAARSSDVRLLAADAPTLFESCEYGCHLAVALREARFANAALLLERAEWLLAPGHERTRARIESMLASSSATVVIESPVAWPAESLPDAIEIELAMPSADERGAMWHEAVREAGHAVSPAHARELGARFGLMPSQIAAATIAAARRAEWRARLDGRDVPAILPVAELFSAAREQSRRALSALAVRIEPRHRWEELILPEDSLAQLREIVQRVAQREQVMETWGFARRLSRGRGTNALFAGPSGTGKTMAAEILAGALGLDLYRVELAGVVSKYIGETEKNLDAIFAAAEGSNAVVFFDEADALFGKRSEVHDAHDRYANIEISYLLQKMEAFDGVAILATNLRGNLDQAFVRRLAFTVHFPFPDEESRRRIWSTVWPTELPTDADVDLAFLSRQFALSGGNIRNVVLAAAFLAAERGGPVAMRDLIAATRREYQKLGKTLNDAELGAWRNGVEP